MAKSAFQLGEGSTKGFAEGYDPDAQLAISNQEMARLGVIHSRITVAQRTLYTAYSKTGSPLTWQTMEQIETQALISGGMQPSMANATAKVAIQALKRAGLSRPTRIPWGG